jgi:uncharacterized protein YwqG
MTRIPEDEPLYAALRERLAANGLPRVVDDLLALAQPAIRLDLTRVEDEAAIPLGASKVGGEPDLPAGTPWPATRDGLPLPFIAQIRLADIARYDPEGDLPHEGLLSFFYAMNDAEGGLRLEDDPTAWRVIWTRDDDTPLSRISTPVALADMLDARFLACSVTFTRRLTLPDSQAHAVTRLGFTNDERLGYIDVTTGKAVGYLPEMDLRLLGYPYELEPTTFEEAYRAAHGIPLPPTDTTAWDKKLQALAHLRDLAQEWRPPEGGYHGIEDVVRAFEDFKSRVDASDLMRTLQAITPPRESEEARRAGEEARAELDRKVTEEWRLLFQVYSNEEAGMDWAGGGVIHFGIRRDALAVRDFSQVWVSLQFL